MKNKWSKEGLYWDEVREEVGKCMTAPRDQGVNVPIVLCIIVAQHNENVAKALQGGRAKFFTACEWFTRADGTKGKGEGEGGDKGEGEGENEGERVLIVPANCYVVIFSREAVAKLLGETAVNGLEHAFSSEFLTTENLRKFTKFALKKWYSTTRFQQHQKGGQKKETTRRRSTHQLQLKLAKRCLSSTPIRTQHTSGHLQFGSFVSW
eukprot:TRINITY_DN3884_c0_g1_i1.p2 TRINITY_DN3884_c0_g1~~TRINITY_DN3884_c0_g1_i1.p2  ORF type:complete len:208 (+),score=35.11 TRINITY_DN3884_c0_g1_i1:783-1406(+)